MNIRSFLITLFSLPMLSGCGDPASFKLATAGLAATMHGVFSSPDVNLKEKSYAAADFMEQDLNRSYIRRRVETVDYAKRMIVHPMTELDNDAITSDFGKKVPEWIGRRFTELGYKTYLYQVTPEGNTMLYPEPPQGEIIDLELKGFYAVHHKTVDVIIRIFDARTGQLVSNFDYTMPLNREIRNMAKTETRIFRINGAKSGVGKFPESTDRSVKIEPLK